MLTFFLTIILHFYGNIFSSFLPQKSHMSTVFPVFFVYLSHPFFKHLKLLSEYGTITIEVVLSFILIIIIFSCHKEKVT